MKFLYCLLLVFLTGLTAPAQHSWEICLNGKTALKSTEESEEKNVLTTRTAGLNSLAVSYTEKNPKDQWERFIGLYDETDRELAKQKGTRLKLANTALKSLLPQSGKIKIYTWALPTDPKRKAAIRVRRVHLCTLILH